MNPKYDSILHLPHHVSRTRPQMSMSDRAAQFAPFAALTGYHAAVQETGRFTDSKIELDEDMLTMLNLKYQLLLEHLSECPTVSFTYFVPDAHKTGGAYHTVTGIVQKIDHTKRLILLQNGAQIPMDDVFNLESDLFAGMPG